MSAEKKGKKDKWLAHGWWGHFEIRIRTMTNNYPALSSTRL